jgi:hypothetical protein
MKFNENVLHFEPIKIVPVVLYGNYSGIVDKGTVLRIILSADAFMATFNDSNKTGAITAFANYGGTVPGTVLVTSAAHGLKTGMYITISLTTNYNGSYLVTRVDEDNYYITAAWVVDDATGTWVHQAAELTIDQTNGAQLKANTEYFVSTGNNHYIGFSIAINPAGGDSIYKVR